jgi:hypothetical protein
LKNQVVHPYSSSEHINQQRLSHVLNKYWDKVTSVITSNLHKNKNVVESVYQTKQTFLINIKDEQKEIDSVCIGIQADVWKPASIQTAPISEQIKWINQWLAPLTENYNTICENHQILMKLKVSKIDYGLYTNEKLVQCVKNAKQSSDLTELINILDECYGHNMFEGMITLVEDKDNLSKFKYWYEKRKGAKEMSEFFGSGESTSYIQGLLNCLTNIYRFIQRHDKQFEKKAVKCTRGKLPQQSTCQLVFNLKKLLQDSVNCESDVGIELILLMKGECGDKLNQCSYKNTSQMLGLFDLPQEQLLEKQFAERD